MHFQYLVEDQSGAALIRILMQKIVELYPNATYDCKGFRGIGGFTRKNMSMIALFSICVRPQAMSASGITH